MFRLPDKFCLLYTSDAADERSSVDLGGRRIIKKKNNSNNTSRLRKRQKEIQCNTQDNTEHEKNT